MKRLDTAELEALYVFYSSTVGLSASTKLQWTLINESASEQDLNAIIWPKIREQLGRDPDLQFILK